MATWAAIVAFMVDKAWPWFLKYAWPLLKAHVISFINEGLDVLFKKFRTAFHENSGKRAEEATKRAEDAEQRAAAADDAIERERWKAKAEAWRQTAEEYESDIKALQEQLRELTEQAKREIGGKIDQINPQLSREAKALNLVLSGQAKSLPSE